jgi:hypothetical protein
MGGVGVTEGFVIGYFIRCLQPHWRYEQDGRLVELVMPHRYYGLPTFTGVTFPG